MSSGGETRGDRFYVNWKEDTGLSGKDICQAYVSTVERYIEGESSEKEALLESEADKRDT